MNLSWPCNKGMKKESGAADRKEAARPWQLQKETGNWGPATISHC